MTPSKTCPTSSRFQWNRALCLGIPRALLWTHLHTRTQTPADFLVEAGGLVVGDHGAAGGPVLGGSVLRAAGHHNLALLVAGRVYLSLIHI